MTRPKARGTVPLESFRKSQTHQRSVDDLTMSSSVQNKDWFKIVNKAAIDTTEIYIYDEIGFWGTSAQEFVKTMMQIDTSKIDLHLNSPGGEIFDGVAIYNALKAHSAEVTVYVDSLAASAASFIAQSGDKVIMARNATMMIHDAAAICWGNQQDMIDTADLLNKLSNNIADIYSQRAGGSVEDWRAFMQEETWYNSQEAVDAGLADIISGEGDKAENKWNLSIFNHAGRSAAPSPESVRERVLSNRVKEAHMSKTPEEIAAEEQVAAEAAAAAEAEAAAAAEVTAAEEAAAVETTASTAATTATAKLAAASTTDLVVNIGGMPTSDPKAIQTYIASLEGFQTETKSTARKNFVATLASGDAPKIGATQVEGLEKFVASLSDAQYEDWTKTWDAAVTLPLLGKYGAGSTNLNGDGSAQEDRLEIVMGTVRQHKLSGMPVDQIQKTPSYNELIKLDPTFKL